MPNRPPALTVMSRLLLRTMGAAAGWRPVAAWAAGTAGLLATFFLDYVTGALVSVLILYLLVVSFAAWSIGERPGLFFAVLVGIGSAAIKHVTLKSGPLAALPGSIEFWNAIVRLMTNCLVAVAVSGMRAAIEMERWRGTIDSLTGVLNNGAFHAQMAGRVKDAKARGQCLVLAYMDLDGFKRVNDCYGHSAGDGVLREFATAAAEVIRGSDLFARIGGDEFVGLMTVETIEDGERLAEMVHDRLSRILAAMQLDVTCSMGAFVMQAQQVDPAGGYVELADKLMYEVKRSGKNALRIGRLDAIGTDRAFPFRPASLPLRAPVSGRPKHARRHRPRRST